MSSALAELRAHEHWDNRDFGSAGECAQEGAETAWRDGDHLSWWQLTFFRAECLREQGAVQQCVQLARGLTVHPIAAKAALLGSRAGTLLSLALRGLGELAPAVTAAAAAATAAATAGAIGHDTVSSGTEAGVLHVQAQLALIAALAESDRLPEAWAECQLLENLLGEDPGDDSGEGIGADIHLQTAGKAYWVLGNVAFLRGEVQAGRQYHELAALRLSPTGDLDLWAKFNSASAQMRLAADIVDQQTLQCIERAELAAGIVGGNPPERLELVMTRAHWHYRVGETAAAVELLRPVCAQSAILAGHTAGKASFLLGRCLHEQGCAPDALRYLDDAATFFERAGASAKKAQVRELIAAG